MKAMQIIAVIASLLGSCFSAHESLASCARYLAPAKFSNVPKSWGSDSGPIVDGFIDVKRPDGTMLDLIHGIDLSHYNEIDYIKFRDCNGKFAFVQMDDAFERHFQGITNIGVTPIPYYFFALPSSMRRAGALPDNPSNDQLEVLRAQYAQAGRVGAEDFLVRLQRVPKALPLTTLAGISGRFVAVDVEQSAIGAATFRQKQRYGQLYATAVCSWLNTVAADPSMAHTVPILYTFPAIYGDYLTYADPGENRCLQGLPVWIARTFPDGGEALHDPTARKGVELYVQRLCIVQSGNRCIIHQYTHRGIFMAARPSGSKIPTHFDLDRFYTAKAVETLGGTQFVREVDPFH